MSPINYPRVLLGTIAAGAVANACNFVINGYLLVEDSRRMVQRLSLDPAVNSSTSVMVTWMAVDFLYAFLIVWNYAAIRPRLGPGPMTAMASGLVIFTGITAILFGFQQMGIFTPDSFMRNTAASFVTAMLMSLAGGWVYSE
jgi:glucan phosphoethanolaminetransferase (alkaline phosphatase superfamily)